MKRTAEIILALDVDTIQKAKYFINELYPEIKIFKVGLQLFTLAGTEIIEFIRSKGAEAFLDLKFLDIPNTVSNAVRQAVCHKVKMITLHIAGGKEMLKAAVSARNDEARRLKIKKPLLVGVTVLTSQKADRKKILALTKAGLACGLDGVVCSAQEAALLRKSIKRDFIIVTPGIRPPAARGDDQKRVATASQAIKAGSDFLVIGRPILLAKEPASALKEMLAAE